MNYIGLMSGTSADGISAVAVAIAEPGILQLLATHHEPYGTALRELTQSLMQAGSNELERAATLDVMLGEGFAAAAQTVLALAGLDGSQIRAIGSHGQTLRHGPQATPPYTVQIGNPAIIAERTGITTIADFRRRDLAAGGQGAPLVPAFHRWLFWRQGVRRIIVNIGGIANITVLPAASEDPVTGFDTGPGNTLLDHWVSEHRGSAYDEGGHWAATGTVDRELLDRLRSDGYFSRLPPKSTGVDYFSPSWVKTRLAAAPGTAPADVQATLTELTACSIGDAIAGAGGGADEVFVCGGGTHNHELMRRLQVRLGAIPLHTTARLGLDPDWVEAAAFAWLAHRTLEGLPGNLPSVTGARHPVVLGAIHPA